MVGVVDRPRGQPEDLPFQLAQALNGFGINGLGILWGGRWVNHSRCRFPGLELEQVLTITFVPEQLVANISAKSYRFGRRC